MASNVNFSVKNNKLVVEVDLAQDFGLSKSEKTRIIGTTNGFVPVDGDVTFSINVVKKVEKKKD